MFTHKSFYLFFLLFLLACGLHPNKEKDAAFDKLTEVFESEEQYTTYRIVSTDLTAFLNSKAVYAQDSAEILAFYKNRDMQYVWFAGDSLSDAAASFLSLFSALKVQPIDTLGRHSLLSKRVQQALERDRGQALSPVERSRLELDLTAQFFRQANKEYGGHVESDLHELDWYIPRRKKNYHSLLDSLVAGKSDLSVLEPVNPQYQALKKALKRLYTLAHIKDSIDLYVDETLDIEIGDSSFVVPMVRERLFELGDIRSLDTTWVYDSTLYAGVTRFKKRMGLSPIENINQDFVAEIEVPVSKRIRTILVNMERCRWLPEKQPPDLILVNIPAFMLYVYEEGKLIWNMDVVVGKVASTTTIFSGEMDRVVFSPYWNVPSSIKNKEILPKIKKDPTYISRNGYELRLNNKTIDAAKVDWSKYEKVMPYMIRQKPGKNNALGQVKFLFPNEFAIYLHDTPSKSKFQETQRAFSHGCIRLSEPTRLAYHLLQPDTVWTLDSIDVAMNSNEQKVVMLEEKIPVGLVYFTAWVNDQGILNFREDVYKHDVRLANELFSHSADRTEL